jgi:hypothetical protein
LDAAQSNIRIGLDSNRDRAFEPPTALGCMLRKGDLELGLEVNRRHRQVAGMNGDDIMVGGPWTTRCVVFGEFGGSRQPGRQLGRVKATSKYSTGEPVERSFHSSLDLACEFHD